LLRDVRRGGRLEPSARSVLSETRLRAKDVIVTVWRAHSAEALGEISGVIHDAYFDYDEVRYDPEAGVVRVPFGQAWDWPPLNEDPEWRDAPRTEFVRKTWRYTQERVPFMRGVLMIRQVQTFTPDARAGEAGMLLSLDHDAGSGKLTVNAVSGDLVAVVSSVDVEADLRPDEVALWVVRRRGRIGVSERPERAPRPRPRPAAPSGGA
jgi:hypothetical protein